MEDITMWTRAELKETGRNAFKANYWRTVLVSVIAMVIAGAGGSSIGAGGSSGAGAGTDIVLLRVSDKLLVKTVEAIIARAFLGKEVSDTSVGIIV